MILNNLVCINGIKIRFILVGIWNTIFGYGIFVILNTYFSMIFNKNYVGYMSAMVIGQVISIINAFIFHKLVTFKSLVRGFKVFYEFLRFSMTYTLIFFVNLILLPFFVEMMGITPNVSAAIILPITAGISYFVNSGYTFIERKD